MFINSNLNRNDVMSVVLAFINDEDDMKRFIYHTYLKKYCKLVCIHFYISLNLCEKFISHCNILLSVYNYIAFILIVILISILIYIYTNIDIHTYFYTHIDHDILIYI